MVFLDTDLVIYLIEQPPIWGAKTTARFITFFASPDVQVLALTAAACDRAARIRAVHNFKPLDSLHLATAVEAGCSLFLTSDAALARFSDIQVEVLM